ncbi:Predicted small metal-binding protein [Methanolobus vulcani]|jgi:predicted small metal-binding protein|uniref:Predicted small metal-binding protein n=1 Tax=Methanolobus vulcani TaxID=38026 RepID=A0A7Z7AWL4_9EURY|nr:DUF1059 domain-containing protein [Methanolobus vulcani]MDK2947487.1 hypothetical protein [Methanolobus sp.]SDF85008.1 Predicted small metal-binding protein [Methanolobus vulcani]
MKIRMVKCSDIGIDGCNYMAIGNNLDEVEQNMFEHIDTEHKDILDSMTEHQVHHLKHRVSTFLGRSCGCGHHH